MLAAKIYDFGDIRLEEMERPRVGADDILCAQLRAGSAPATFCRGTSSARHPLYSAMSQWAWSRRSAKTSVAFAQASAFSCIIMRLAGNARRAAEASTSSAPRGARASLNREEWRNSLSFLR